MSRIQNFEQIIEQLKPYLREYLEDHNINTKKNFNCIDPDHDDSVASAGLVPGSDFTRFHCFSCGSKGDILDAVSFIENKPEAGPEFISETILPLCEKFGIDVKLKEPTEEEQFRIDTFTAYKKASNYISNNLSENKLALSEVERRGWDINQCISRGIGAVSDYEAYKNYMIDSGFTASFLSSVDLLRTDLFNGNNLMFTICDQHGRPVGFGARNLAYKTEGNELPKYINTAAKCPIYEKSKLLYSLSLARKEPGTLYLMEGYSDVETAIQHGIKKVCAVAGTAFTDYHPVELARLGITDITICMDGDTQGLASIERMIEKFNDHREFSVKVIKLPDSLDPDDYIRTHGTKQFLRLKVKTAFEWMLDQYDDRIDTALIRKEVVPIVASESSPIERERMCKILSDKIGVSANSIIQEVDQRINIKDTEKEAEKNSLIKTLINDLKNHPSDWRFAINQTVQNLESLSETHTEDMLSEGSYIKELDLIKEEEENSEDNLNPHVFTRLREFGKAVEGDWRSTLNLIGGGANTGKTALMSDIAVELAIEENRDSIVLFHTIDDTLKQFTTRLVLKFAQEKMPGITLNMVKRPMAFSSPRMINAAREYGYQKLKELVATGRLMVRSGENGSPTLSFANDWVTFTRKRYPDREIIYMLDNFHRLKDFAHFEERIRFKKLSDAAKEMSKKHDMCTWATVEYNKMGSSMGKPTNNSISESIAMEYDANVITHVYNDLHSRRDEATVYFWREDSLGQRYKAPRVEVIFGKNKINEYKGTMFFDFYTEQSMYVPVPYVTAMEDKKIAEEERRGQRPRNGNSGYNQAA